MIHQWDWDVIIYSYMYLYCIIHPLYQYLYLCEPGKYMEIERLHICSTNYRFSDYYIILYTYHYYIHIITDIQIQDSTTVLEVAEPLPLEFQDGI